jgi:dTDP-4-amino-4,6-dideoxygalactose transaminase
MIKATIEELAILGGKPAFESALHVGRPNIGNRHRFEERLADLMDRRWLTNGGPYVQEFEQRIAELASVKHCIAMCNATVALEIAIRALGMTGEVIVPSFTFIATAHALQWQGIVPVFCDVDPKTHLMDPRLVEELITPKTTGIIPVHLWGRPCAVEAFADIALRYHLKVIYDAAHAFACSYKGTMIGSFGDAEVFSFHATKFLNSLEGGAVVTNNAELARKMRLMKNFGFTDYDKTEYLGTNGKMNEVSAAIGLTNLESMNDFVAVNRRNYQRYADELAGLEGVTFLTYDEKEKCNYQYVVLEIDQDKTIVTRDQLMEILHKENVLARRYFYPGCHRMEPYRSRERYRNISLPETERLAASVMSFPNGTAVGEEEIQRICEVVRFVLANGAEVSARLQSRSVPAGNNRSPKAL